jgi:hypothetical protein
MDRPLGSMAPIGWKMRRQTERVGQQASGPPMSRPLQSLRRSQLSVVDSPRPIARELEALANVRSYISNVVSPECLDAMAELPMTRHASVRRLAVEQDSPMRSVLELVDRRQRAVRQRVPAVLDKDLLRGGQLGEHRLDVGLFRFHDPADRPSAEPPSGEACGLQSFAERRPNVLELQVEAERDR